MQQLTLRQRLLVASMLFGMFFGAGNLIFPASMGQLAGRSIWQASAGFLITGVGLPLLGLVPEDASVVLAAASGRLLIDFTEQGAAKACHNLAGRLEGRRVPLMKLKK